MLALEWKKKTDGYGVQSVIWPDSDGRRRSVGVPRLILMMKLGLFLKPEDGDSRHLCHKRDSCNPNHIILESR